jgi:hypothetical protein
VIELLADLTPTYAELDAALAAAGVPGPTARAAWS